MPAVNPNDPRFFLPYQRRWLADKSRIKLVEKSRQIGWTYATAYDLTRSKAVAGVKYDAWVTSRDADMAQLFLQDCKEWARMLGLAFQDSGMDVLARDKRDASFVLRFASGAEIHSLSSNADAQAGKRGDRVLDEFALHPDQRKLWAIAYPGITWGGQMSIISTHRGSQSLFNQLILEAREGGNPKGISLHRVTLQDALDQGFLRKLKSKLPPDDPRQAMDEAAYFDYVRSGCVDEESFLQEYMCVPSDDESAFISYDLLDGCTMPRNEEWELPLERDKTYYLGVDIGRKHDLTVLYLVEAAGEQRITRRIVEMRNTPFFEQQHAIDTYAQLPQVRRVCIDATGIGRQLAEDTRRRHGGKVEEVTFTAGVKEDLAISLRRCMEDRALRIPNHKELHADLRSIRKQTTSAGNVRYVGERTADGHADRFWALALAIHAGKAPTTHHIGVVRHAARPASRRGWSMRGRKLHNAAHCAGNPSMVNSQW
ncbi:MAG: terminase family protein [Akkermansiaceae bacterium]|nr:terminase family protein [Akkermansiaceae bacterium]